MEVTGTMQAISPINLFVQAISTVLLVFIAVIAIKFMIRFLKSK